MADYQWQLSFSHIDHNWQSMVRPKGNIPPYFTSPCLQLSGEKCSFGPTSGVIEVIKVGERKILTLYFLYQDRMRPCRCCVTCPLLWLSTTRKKRNMTCLWEVCLLRPSQQWFPRLFKNKAFPNPPHRKFLSWQTLQRCKPNSFDGTVWVSFLGQLIFSHHKMFREHFFQQLHTWESLKPQTSCVKKKTSDLTEDLTRFKKLWYWC